MRLLKRFQSIYFLFFILLFTTRLAVINGVEMIPILNDICEFELSARVLYLKPNVGDTHFVLTSFDNTFKGSPYPKGKRHQNTPSYDFGYAVEGIYTLCPSISSLSLQSTFFNTRSTRSISGDFLYDTNGFPGFGTQDSPVYNGTATSANTYQFLSGDLNYNRSCSEFLPDNLSFVIGLHSAYIKFKEHTTSVGTFTNSPRPIANNLHRNSQFWGIGPQIGLDFEMPFSRFCCSYNTLTLIATQTCCKSL